MASDAERGTPTMGAWSADTFGNDDAMDWAADLEDAQDADFVGLTLLEVLDSEEPCVEAPCAARGLAAAEVVAGLRGAPAAALPDEVLRWVVIQRGDWNRALVTLALRVLRRVRERSELADLWKDGGDGEWNTALDDLERRLVGA